jgi:hypothetical protein
MRPVEEDHEHAILALAAACSISRSDVGSMASDSRSRGPNDDVLGRLDLLQDAILQDLEIGRAKISDRLAILRRIGINADEVGLRPECWCCLIGLGRL